MPVGVILAEWARLGGATIVNGDRVPGPPVTLEFTGVPERQALDIVLRSVAGYLLASRRAGSNGASAFDRILILPTSVAPRTPPPPAVASSVPRPLLRRPPIVARRLRAGAPTDAGQDDIAPVGAQGSAELNPPRTGDPRLLPQPFVTQPLIQSGTGPLDLDEEPDDASGPRPATPAGNEPTPTNPFGIPFGSSARPGVVTPVLQ